MLVVTGELYKCMCRLDKEVTVTMVNPTESCTLHKHRGENSDMKLWCVILMVFCSILCHVLRLSQLTEISTPAITILSLQLCGQLNSN